MKIKLKKETLSQLPEQILVPQYDRRKITPGIIHIGVGNFHRAHQAVYLNNLFNLGLDHDWGIIGAGIKTYDRDMRKKLEEQDWLSTVVELESDNLKAHVSGSMIDFINVSPTDLINALCRPEIRIISMTITEGGYFLDERTGGVNYDDPEIQHDIKYPEKPETVFGILIAGLLKRQKAGFPPFTIMSCDNLTKNGNITKKITCSIASRNYPDFAEWIEENVAFPNTMVDCITPAVSETEKNMVREKIGVDDHSPVICEPFRQWIMEDNFPQGRPALEKVDVKFVNDILPYELMKLRILNGGHAAIAYPSALMGIDYVHDAISNPLISAFIEKLQREEIIPTLKEVPDVSFHKYWERVRERFANTGVSDRISRLCLDGSNRQPKFILPTIADRLKKNQSVKGLALEVAFWCQYCLGFDEYGKKLNIIDKQAERLRDHAVRAKEQPAVFLEMTDIFGTLGEHDGFKKQFTKALETIYMNGTHKALEKYLNC